MVHIGNSWDERLKEEWDKPYYQNLRKQLVHEYRTQRVYPAPEELFNALKLVDFEDAKVVLLGQDPYHGAGQAHGLAFSVKKGVAIPPSLKNMYKELHDDLQVPMPVSGNLEGWARQGVLLLNTSLSVRAGKPQSHRRLGWEVLTDEIIQQLNERTVPLVFLLWGRNARNKKSLITNPRHLLLEAPHPSPLSAFSGFFGCRHFSKTNAFLAQNDLQPIRWEENE